jgi:hypothetical protein
MLLNSTSWKNATIHAAETDSKILEHRI